jgi:uncharacterized protein (TIGR03435 family)
VPPIPPDSDRVSISHATVLGLIARAYGVRNDQILGPGWLTDPGNRKFQIAAKAPQDVPRGHILEMLQSLLADRFGVKTHWEMKNGRGFALTVAKAGPKLKASAVRADGTLERSASMSGSGRYTWQGTTMEEFAAALTRLMGAPVVDMTGIRGPYDIVLEAAPDSMPGLPARGGAAESNYPSIFGAIKALGLTLEVREVSVKVLVVDAANKLPTGN